MGICWQAKDFPMSPEVDADAGEMSQCFYHVLQSFYDHFQTLGEYEAYLIVCPSVVNLGQCNGSIKVGILLSSVSTCASAFTPVHSRSDSMTRLIAE